MATLTIKPTAAGNDVQIKSGDGNTTHATFGDTNNISMSTGSIASAVTGTLGSGIVFPAGHILQTVQYVEDQHSTWSSSSTWRDMGMDLSITLSNASHKVLVTVLLHVGAASDGYLHYRVERNGSDLALGVARSSCTRCLFMTNIDSGHGQHEIMITGITYLDDPSETTITPLAYKIYSHAQNGQQHLNRCEDGADYNRGQPVSTITLQEIAV